MGDLIGRAGDWERFLAYLDAGKIKSRAECLYSTSGKRATRSRIAEAIEGRQPTAWVAVSLGNGGNVNSIELECKHAGIIVYPSSGLVYNRERYGFHNKSEVPYDVLETTRKLGQDGRQFVRQALMVYRDLLRSAGLARAETTSAEDLESDLKKPWLPDDLPELFREPAKKCKYLYDAAMTIESYSGMLHREVADHGC